MSFRAHLDDPDLDGKIQRARASLWPWSSLANLFRAVNSDASTCGVMDNWRSRSVAHASDRPSPRAYAGVREHLAHVHLGATRSWRAVPRLRSGQVDQFLANL
jgi:hypothetical protein